MGALFSALGSLSGIITLAGKAWDFFTSWRHDKDVKTAQQAVDAEQNAAEALGEVQEATEARNRVADDLARDPSSLRNDDGFARGRPSGAGNNPTDGKGKP